MKHLIRGEYSIYEILIYMNFFKNIELNMEDRYMIIEEDYTTQNRKLI